MAETVNIGEISNRLSEDIFKHFGWVVHPKRDDNFPCVNPNHTVKSKKADASGKKIQQKKTHPGDVVFHYQDPYIGRRVYLHTDLKSYAKDSVSSVKLRSAIESLAMTVECGRSSEVWRTKYSVPEGEAFDLRGLLFVHNHDGLYMDDFDETVRKTKLGTIPIAPGVYIHLIGPHDISRLYTIANDIIRLKYEKLLPEKYSFYYPDLVMWHRKGDVYSQSATIEALTAPYFIINYEGNNKLSSGYVIYYNRSGSSVAEFQYFLDSLSRYQMLEPDKFIRIRMVSKAPSEEYLSHFDAAKEQYARAWGFDESRMEVMNAIQLSPVTAVASTYSAPIIGWRAGND
ncbi:hypothetical protein [Hydrogenophaga sp. 5NK40-0174]|uniref:hypothetical protein n=1 Tax=Hydrogenophaga sp. 5NK40-0174 TaxID=3127649 RepID=UPI0031032559